MAFIIDIRESFRPKEKEELERIEGVTPMRPGDITIPAGWEAWMIDIDATLVELMTPPQCPWCQGVMNAAMSQGGLIITYTCPECGGVERSERVPPEGV